MRPVAELDFDDDQGVGASSFRLRSATQPGLGPKYRMVQLPGHSYCVVCHGDEG